MQKNRAPRAPLAGTRVGAAAAEDSTVAPPKLSPELPRVIQQFHFWVYPRKIDVGHLGCFLFLTIAINAAMNSRTRFRVNVFISLGHELLAGISRSNGNSIFHILRNHQTVFPRDCAILQTASHMRGLQFLHIPSNVLVVCLQYSLPGGCGVASRCGFDLRSPNDWRY